MEVLYERCAGLDVHKKTVVASVRIATENKLITEVRTFSTTTSGLLKLSDWLSESGCTHVAMEATGVYWKPVWHVLSDGELELVLANAAHVKNVPGRKTDVSDAAWLAELMAHGLIRASFVPDTQTQELRALLRTRKQLVRETTRHIQRIHKTLEDANIKLESQLSDILGKSGRSILDALVAGETDPVRLAALAHPNVKCSQAATGEPCLGQIRRIETKDGRGLHGGQEMVGAGAGQCRGGCCSSVWHFVRSYANRPAMGEHQIECRRTERQRTQKNWRFECAARCRPDDYLAPMISKVSAYSPSA